MSIFLKAKHWQLFVVLFGSMVAGQAIVLSTVLDGGFPDQRIFIGLTALLGLLLFGWIWSISVACYRALPKELASSPKIMQAGLVYAFAYMLLGQALFVEPGQSLPGYVFALHILAMAAIFYALGFTAKQLTKLEYGKKVDFFAYSGPFFLLWFFPIGVWFIQPKVNRLLDNGNA